jgi:hypothetical protein
MKYCWAPVTHVCNPSYSEGRDQEDHCSRLLQIVCKTLSRKNPSQKRAGRVAHSVGPEFKPQYCKKKKEKKILLLNLSLKQPRREGLKIFLLTIGC